MPGDRRPGEEPAAPQPHSGNRKRRVTLGTSEIADFALWRFGWGMWIETAVIWLKVVHVGGLVLWAGLLFYMPALFAAHVRPMDTPEFHRLRTISRITYVGIASPAAVMTIISGTALVVVTRVEDAWLVLKLGIVFLLLIYHIHCGTVLSRLAARPTARRRGSLLALMIVPALLLPAVLVLAIDKPL